MGTGMVMCLGRDADLLTAQLMPLPLAICCSSNPDGFYLSGTSSPGYESWTKTGVVVVVFSSCSRLGGVHQNRCFASAFYKIDVLPVVQSTVSKL